ncbi:hypothetical protein SB717_33360 [Priestia sp. SIMBA_032]|uniref:hypothetical protein n=1 Tax=Priestia sp. SIMBA_032 TaxID=3085775 RepID=UPI00397BA69B
MRINRSEGSEQGCTTGLPGHGQAAKRHGRSTQERPDRLHIAAHNGGSVGPELPNASGRPDPAHRKGGSI